jgi:hypothetical protein
VTTAEQAQQSATGRPGLLTVAREWSWIGCVGFGGPPAHIALLRQLCVERRRWLEAREFEDAIVATNLLPDRGARTHCGIGPRARLRPLPGTERAIRIASTSAVPVGPETLPVWAPARKLEHLALLQHRAQSFPLWSKPSVALRGSPGSPLAPRAIAAEGEELVVPRLRPWAHGRHESSFNRLCLRASVFVLCCENRQRTAGTRRVHQREHARLRAGTGGTSMTASVQQVGAACDGA